MAKRSAMANPGRCGAGCINWSRPTGRVEPACVGQPSLHRRHDKFGTHRIGFGPALRDGLETRIEAKAFGTVGVMIAEHGITPATETVESHRYRNRHIHADHAYLDVGNEGACNRTALREHRGTIRILVGVDEIDRGPIVGDPHDTEHRTEYLLAIDAHVGTHRVEQ